MAAYLISSAGGRSGWNAKRDSEGHREYKIKHKVRTDSVLDGPATVMTCSGLPAVGSVWNFGNEVDLWAFCWPDMKVEILEAKSGQPSILWEVEQKFSTKPLSRCQDESIEDPLLEPPRLSGSFVKYTKAVREDRNGDVIQSSSFEPLHGPQVEFDFNRPTVRIGMNVALLGLATFAEMVDTVNDASLWGLPERTIKLSNVSWERLLYGVCNFYYTITYEFDIDFDTFDRTVDDVGFKALNGHWSEDGDEWVLDNINGAAPDATNPAHFKQYKDRNDENSQAILDGGGKPWNGSGSGPGTVDIEYYSESNFLLLGIPTVF